MTDRPNIDIINLSTNFEEVYTMTKYEMTEHAYHLIDGGWTGADESLFREEDAKQDRPLAPDDITGIFEEIRRIERNTADN